MARQSEKILTDPQVGEVLMVKSDRSRSISIRVHPVKGVRVSVPRIVPFAAAVAFYKMKRNWVLEVMARQRERFKDVQVASPDEVEALRRKAKAELPSRLAELAGRYGFVYNRVVIKHNATNWGSCSSKNNINLNLNIVRLPKVLQDYILLHELCHLRHHDHGHAFHLLLEHLLTDNLMKLLADSSLSNEDTVLNSDLAKKAAVSKARFPVDYTMSLAIKQYKLV
jgi:predicted metal-dependent hydrolase